MELAEIVAGLQGPVRIAGGGTRGVDGPGAVDLCAAMPDHARFARQVREAEGVPSDILSPPPERVARDALSPQALSATRAVVAAGLNAEMLLPLPVWSILNDIVAGRLRLSRQG